jgi:hypothetical protein
MVSRSKSFAWVTAPVSAGIFARRLWLQVAIAYLLILVAVWTPNGALKLVWVCLAAIFIVVPTAVSGYSIRQLGIHAPPKTGTFGTLIAGIALASAIPLGAALLGANVGTRPVPWQSAWQYAIWAVIQQFILQSFFYVRLEGLLGSRRALPVAAALFAAAHLPSPVLTGATFLGGLFFCEMFRRYRNIYPLGVVHALWGLTVARSFSDAILHHMQVGIGYLSFHR